VVCWFCPGNYSQPSTLPWESVLSILYYGTIPSARLEREREETLKRHLINFNLIVLMKGEERR
jgi:hypothetical protein